MVEEALRAGVTLERVLVVDPPPPAVHRLLAMVGPEFTVVRVAPHVLEAVSGVETPQGVAAVAVLPQIDPEPVLALPDLLLLVVDRVQDPGNLGTMIRTADAAGAAAVALVPGTVDPYNPKTVRATMGSLFHLPVLAWPDDDLIGALRRRGVRILVTETTGTVDYRDASYTRPVAIVVGNEAEGVDDAWRAAADARVRIPIVGRAESLNAAIAAALVLYEAIRRGTSHEPT